MTRFYSLIIASVLFMGACVKSPSAVTTTFSNARGTATYTAGGECVIDTRPNISMRDLDELYRFCARHHMIYLTSQNR